jgi:hypothetical protein
MDACRQMLADDHLERIPSTPLWPGSLHNLNTYKRPQTARTGPSDFVPEPLTFTGCANPGRICARDELRNDPGTAISDHVTDG